ncbi:MAG: Bacterial polymerase, alpha chain terminal domain [Candidatus Parcubacteria bacterium]|jgi:DNA-directed RNA polymerase alpha subunit
MAQQVVDQALETIIQEDVMDLDVSWRAKALFKGNEIKTIEDLASKSPTQILCWKGCGRKTFHEIRDALSKKGLEWGTEFVRQRLL